MANVSVAVNTECLAALLYSPATVDLPEDVRGRIACEINRSFAIVNGAWIYLEDLQNLLGVCENGGVPLLPVTENGRIQSPEEKLDDGHIKLDYEGIFFTYAYESLKKKLP
jgi:hypothetical protein